jgi:hypothetical protein
MSLAEAVPAELRRDVATVARRGGPLTTVTDTATTITNPNYTTPRDSPLSAHD